MARRRWKWGLRLVALVALLCAGAAWAEMPTLSWQPGFPLRAGKRVLLMWLPFPGADHYVVIRREVPSGAEVRSTVQGLQYVDEAAEEVRTYSYLVQAILPGERAGPRTEEKRLEGVKLLDAPKWSGTLQVGTTVNLLWEGVDGAAFYNLYRSEEGGPLQLRASVQEPRFVDTGLKPLVSYAYRLRAVGIAGQQSAESAPVQVLVEVKERAAPEAGPERRFVEVVRSIHEGIGYRLQEPTDLAVSRGTLFVTNVGSRSVMMLTLEGEIAGEFAAKPLGYSGEWGLPWGIGVSADGNRIGVTFLRSSNVRVFDRRGALLLDVPVGKPPGLEEHPEVAQPMDVAMGPDDDLWVTDYTYGQVVHLSSSGRELNRVGAPKPEGIGPFRSPTFLMFDASRGQVYVVDSLLAEIFAADRDGRIVGRWSRAKEDTGTLSLPKGICAAPDGRLLIVDGMLSSLQSFDPAGKVQAVYYSKDKEYLALRGLVSAAVDAQTGDIYALSKVDGVVYRLKTLR